MVGLLIVLLLAAILITLLGWWGVVLWIAGIGLALWLCWAAIELVLAIPDVIFSSPPPQKEAFDAGYALETEAESARRRFWETFFLALFLPYLLLIVFIVLDELLL